MSKSDKHKRVRASKRRKRTPYSGTQRPRLAQGGAPVILDMWVCYDPACLAAH